MNLNEMLLGAIIMASSVAGLFFLRFWRDTRDRFFLFFAASFFLEAVNRAVFWHESEPNAEVGPYYMLRLLSFILIIVAIFDKNRPIPPKE
ncbi:MAG TPA: DUF5985 family protein [Burkholderiaceae bacterium]